MKALSFSLVALATLFYFVSAGADPSVDGSSGGGGGESLQKKMSKAEFIQIYTEDIDLKAETRKAFSELSAEKQTEILPEDLTAESYLEDSQSSRYVFLTSQSDFNRHLHKTEDLEVNTDGFVFFIGFGDNDNLYFNLTNQPRLNKLLSYDPVFIKYNMMSLAFYIELIRLGASVSDAKKYSVMFLTAVAL